MRSCFTLASVCALSATAAVTAGPVGIQTGELIITEIMQNPSAVGNASGEAFEVYNPGTLAVDMNGMTIRDDGGDSFTINVTLEVPAGGYVVFGNNADISTNGGIDVDFEYTNMFIGNSDDEIEIVSDDGTTIIDRVAYDGGPTFPDPNGASMQLSFNQYDVNANDLGANWCETPDTEVLPGGDFATFGADNVECFFDCNDDGIPDDQQLEGNDCNNNMIPDDCEPDCNDNGFPDDCDITVFMTSDDCNSNGIPDECEDDCDGDGIPNDCAIQFEGSPDVNGNGIPDECELPTGNIFINEFLADPDATLGDANQDGNIDTTQDEFVEIYNGTGADVDISGWTITDAANGVVHVFPAGTMIVNDCVIVVFGGGSPDSVNFGGATVQTASTGGLSLNNGGDTISLLDLAQVTVDAVTYGGEAGNNQSRNRNPEAPATTGVFVDHTTIISGVVFSPGRRIDQSDTENIVLAFWDGCPPPFADCNNDGIPDDDQLVGNDCNNNGIPDDCDPDCDGNGVPDDCDIDGGAADSDGDGILDVCEDGQENILINEIRIDQAGGDNDEYFELIGPANQSLEGLTYVVIGDGNNGSGHIEMALSLDGQSLNDDGLFIAYENTFSLVSQDPAQDLILVPNDLNFENSDNVTHVLVRDFTGAVNDDIDDNDDGVPNAMLPWALTIDAIGIVEEVFDPVDPGVSPAGEWAYGIALDGERIGPDLVQFDPPPAEPVAVLPVAVYRACVGSSTVWTIGFFDQLDPVNSTDTPRADNIGCDGGSGTCPWDTAGGGALGNEPDGEVGVPDFFALLQNWGPCPGGPCPWDTAGGGALGDEPDGEVGVPDFFALLQNWGPCP